MKRNVVGIRTAAILGALVAGAAIFASCATTGKRVTVLTYNTHLFGGSNAASAQELKNIITPFWIKKDVVVLDDDERLNKIVEELKRGQADIVALQELWACDRPMNLAEKLREVYPHGFYSTQSCQYASWDTLARETLGEFARRHPLIKIGLFLPWEGTLISGVLTAARYKEFEPIAIEIIKEKYKIADGLLLLSKYPIETPMFHEFLTGRTAGDKDQLARKGVITATIVLPNGLRLRVGVTHANTDIGGPGLPDIADLASWTTTGASEIGPTIMMGDLNVSDTNNGGAEYSKMANIFTGVGAVDAYRQVNKRNGVTVNWAANPLMRVFYPEPEEPQKKPQSIDYVFYRPDGPGLTIKPESAKVITGWKYPHEIKRKPVESWDLSDHYPVLVTFSLWNGPNPVTWADPEPARAR
ncbi:MAG: endonuclease/exonuclease/phosphatase family protein [bacterium]|jgi:endonuclease/exonuclease/phosphatase family metal-dependent hydrolase